MFQKYSSYILCLLISILVVSLYVNDFTPLVQAEWKIQDLMYTFKGNDNFSSDIVLVNINEETLEQFGEWPWHRDKIADLLAAVGSGEPKTILLDMIFDHDINEDTLGYTNILAGQMSWIKNIILKYEISRAEFMTARVSTPKYLYNAAIEVDDELGILDENATLLAQKVFLPPEQLCEYAAGLGFKYDVFDKDRKVRWEPLVVHYEGYYYPSATLLAAANYLEIDPSAITVFGGERIETSSINIPTSSRGELFINYNKPGKSFSQVSASDILNEVYDISSLQNKLVILSMTSKTASNLYRTPVSNKLRGVEKTANVIENIIHSNFVNRVDSSPGRDILILFGCGALFAFILPRVGLLYRFIILLVSLFVVANFNFILFNSYDILTRPLYIALQIFLLLLASPFLDNALLSKLSFIRIRFESKPETTQLPKVALPRQRKTAYLSNESCQSSNEVGRREQPRKKKAQSQETVGIETPAELNISELSNDGPSNNEARGDAREENLEREHPQPSQQNDRASSVTPNNGGSIQQEGAGAERPQESAAGSAGESSPNSVISSDEWGGDPEADAEFGSDSKPIRNLGRYEVLGQLGKGAMGMVYKGVDPAINRNVALKTIRLDFVNDPDELAELKERLFTEARAAGKLSHPNIVTIYDVGTEGKLQYIAMEYLEGQTLENMIRRKTKFNYRIIAEIITQICSALDYAHSQGIVHRDIKPANIMVLKDYRIKVMDFGIARVDTSSMTRTGIAMGTPNYIAPELLQGKSVDRRCDIFSLGVVIYEMLLNRRPFRGENLTSLIYSIVNTEAEPPSSVDKSIPLIFDRIIDKALKKDPSQRYQTAAEIASAVSDFLETFSTKRTSTV
jgi:serine/threonine-protein kinase